MHSDRERPPGDLALLIKKSKSSRGMPSGPDDRHPCQYLTRQQELAVPENAAAAGRQTATRRPHGVSRTATVGVLGNVGT